MTLPDERLRAVNNAREFLRDLLDPSITPRVPKAVRRRAHSVLKHFPAEYEMDTVAEAVPHLFTSTQDWFSPCGACGKLPIDGHKADCKTFNEDRVQE